MGASRDCPTFLGTPYYLRNGKSYGFQIWPVYSEGPSEQIPLKILEKRERGRIQGLPAQFFRVPRVISDTAKAAIFKFCTQIYRLNRNNNPLKISGKVAVGILPKIFWAPIHRAHRAVIFATTQLSCLVRNLIVE